MARLALRYPGYGWEHNAGYATRDHVAGLRELGVTRVHRRTYQRIRAILDGDQLAFDLAEDADGGLVSDDDDRLRRHRRRGGDGESSSGDQPTDVCPAALT